MLIGHVKTCSRAKKWIFLTFFRATCHTNWWFSAKLSIFGQSFQNEKVDLGIDLDFLFLHNSYWTHLDLFQSKNVQKFPNFNVWKSITWKVCIFGATSLKIKVDPCTNLQLLFWVTSYWTRLNLFQRILLKIRVFCPKNSEYFK